MEKVSISKLGRQDWLEMGLQTLIDKGIEAVRVEPLAKFLGITRGSFYWHFKNRGDLLAAMLQEWETRNTESIIEKIETLDTNPADKLLSLLEIAARDDNRLEKAVRIWAANDLDAAATISRVDGRRLDYLHNLFCQLGFSTVAAKVRAQVTYSMRLGWFMMAEQIEPSERLAQIHLVHPMLSKP
jgi:AcrR family transcriptional regulator